MTPGITNLRCEYRKDPEGIDVIIPRLSWELKPSEYNYPQEAYQILAASSPDNLTVENADLWDSGKIVSSQMNQILYQGQALNSFQECFWKIIVWLKTSDSKPTICSQTAKWSMGLLSPGDWQGDWISYHCEGVKDAPYFRKDFNIEKSVKRAVIYSTARGVINTFINGSSPADEILAPGWTDYRKRIYYRAYDITEHLVTGKNTLGAMLSEGWYKGPLGFSGDTCFYGRQLMLLINLRLEYTDGSMETIATDERWKTQLGPILQSAFLYGENYDARMEMTGWATPGFDDRNWQNVDTFEFGNEFWDNAKGFTKVTTKIEAHPAEPVQAIREFKATSCWETLPGSYVFDLGRNIAGKARIKVKGKPGQMIRLRFGEILNKDRSLYVENLRAAYSTDTYIIKSAEEEIWEPCFTFHGFQYVEITGIDNPALDTITGIAIGSSIEKTGEFICSNEDINTLFNNTYWTQRANFIEVPTDCPQRDERLGWTGDALAFVNTAAYNTDVAAFFTKWLKDVRDTQHEDGSIANVAPSVDVALEGLAADAAWADALFGCPWAIYEFYGDTRILQENYGAMEELLRYYEATSKDYIRKGTHCFGDWLSDDANTPDEVIQTAFFARGAQLVASIAKILNKPEDASKYNNLADKIKEAFINEFVNKNGDIKGSTQTAYLLGLGFDLVPKKNQSKTIALLIKNLKDRGYRLSTGFIGTALLMPTLSRLGLHDVAYKLLLQTKYPSWLFPIKNGATSIWERWNGWMPETGPGDSSMNSYSHYAFGAVVEWLYRTVAGIDMLKPGFEEIKIQPVIGGDLTWANCSYRSIRGKITSNWKVEGNTLCMTVKIPANTKAQIHVPAKDINGISINDKAADSIKNIKLIHSVTDVQVFETIGGSYNIRVTNFKKGVRI